MYFVLSLSQDDFIITYLYICIIPIPKNYSKDFIIDRCVFPGFSSCLNTGRSPVKVYSGS